MAFSALAVAVMLNGMAAPLFSLILAAGMPAISLTMNVTGFVILAPLTYVLVGRFGLAGAAAAWLIFNCAYYVIVPWVLARRLPLVDVKRFYLRDTLPYALLAIAFFGAGRYFTQGLGVYPTLGIALACGCCYLLVAVALSPALRQVARDSSALVTRRSAA